MMVQRRTAFTVILVALVCSASVLGASEKPEEKAKQDNDDTAKKSDTSEKSISTIPAKSVTARQARRGNVKAAVKDEEGSKKPVRSTAEASASGPTRASGPSPAATNGPPASYSAFPTGSSPTTGFTSTADSPYAHLFHPSALDLSSFFAPQFQSPGKQEQLDLASLYAQYNTGPATFGNSAANFFQQPQATAGKQQQQLQQQSIYNYQQPGGQVYVSQPGLRQPNSGDIVYQSQKPATAQDYKYVYQTIKQQQKSNPVVFPTQKVPVANDYSTVYQAQRPNVANLRKPVRKPVKVSATYQSQRAPSAAEYDSVYQKSPTATPNVAPIPSSAPTIDYSQLQYAQVPQQALYVPQNAYAAQPNLPQAGPVKVDVNSIVSNQVLPQIQQQGGQGIQLLDLSAFYPQQQQQNKGQPLFQVTGGKTLSPVQLNPSLYQHLQQQLPQQHDAQQHAGQPPVSAVPTLSPEQLAAFYKSIGAQPPPPPSPASPTAAGHHARPTAPAPTAAVYSAQAAQAYSPNAVAYNPAASGHPSAGVTYQYPQQQQVAAAPVDLSAYYNAINAAQAQQGAAAQQAQGQHAQTPSVLPHELATIYRQQQTVPVSHGGAPSAGHGSSHQASPNVVYVSAGQDANDVYSQYAAQPGAGQGSPAQFNYSPGQAVYYTPQYQVQGQGSKQPAAANYAPPSNIANLISQLTSNSGPTSSPAYFNIKPTVAESYIATTAAAAPRRPRPQQLKHVTAPLPSLNPTPNPTPAAMPQKTRQLVKKPHNFGPGYSFEITGR